MLVFIGQVETSYLGREAFQEVDLPRFYSEITKWAVTPPNAERLPEMVARALHIAVSGRPGPTMVALPSDLLDADLAGASDRWLPGVGTPVPPQVSPLDARHMMEVLERASAPVVIAGGGAQHARDELIALVEHLGAGVYASFRRQDVFPNEHPSYCGHLTIGTAVETLEALNSADVVLVVGSRLSEITTQRYSLPRPDQTLLQIDIEPRSVGAVLPVDIGLAADARVALAAMLEQADEPSATRDLSVAHQTYLESSAPVIRDTPRLHQETVMATLVETFPASTIVTTDAGNFTVFAHRYWRFNQPRTQLSPTSGAMGYGIPAAVAAALAEPMRDVLALVGDGGFLMTGQELEVAVRLGLTMTVVVFRNGLYGTIALHQARTLGRLAAVEIGDVDIARVASGYGAEAWQVETLVELRDALGRARDHQGVSVVDVLIDPDVLTPTSRLSTLLDS